MATIRNRHGKWQARVTRKGLTPVSRSFLTLLDAERWARQIESDMDKGAYTNTVLAERTIFKELIQRYMREVTPTMRGAEADLIRLKAICRKSICQINMVALTPSKIAEYRDERLYEVTAGTVIRELCYFSSIINHALESGALISLILLHLFVNLQPPKDAIEHLTPQKKRYYLIL